MKNIQEILDNIGKKYPTNKSVVCESNKRLIYVFSKEGELLEICKKRRDAEVKYGWQTITSILKRNTSINGIWVSYTNEFNPRIVPNKADPKKITIIFNDNSRKEYESRRICCQELGWKEDILYNIKKGSRKTLPQGIKEIIF